MRLESKKYNLSDSGIIYIDGKYYMFPILDDIVYKIKKLRELEVNNAT